MIHTFYHHAGGDIYVDAPGGGFPATGIICSSGFPDRKKKDRDLLFFVPSGKL
jgi:hypothetical protein